MKESLQNKSLRSSVFEYVKDKYKTEPEYLWMRFPNYAVFRHEDNNKWFALAMEVSGDKPDEFTFGVLREAYGIYAVRGPRGIPNSLRSALK